MTIPGSFSRFDSSGMELIRIPEGEIPPNLRDNSHGNEAQDGETPTDPTEGAAGSRDLGKDG